MCSSRKQPYPPPHSRTEGNGNSDGKAAGGVQEGRNFRGGGGVASRGLFPGVPSKAGELSKTNSRSVEQALSYFTVELWFSAMIFHYQWAEFFFHGLRDR